MIKFRDRGSRSSDSDAHNLARSSVYFGVGREVWLL
jgi:hypothetical protein